MRRLVAGEHVAVAIHQQIRAPRGEIAVATQEARVSVTAGIQEALLHRPGRGGRRLQAPRVRDLPEAGEVDESDHPARPRIVHWSASADPVVVACVEVLEGKHLKGVICGERRPNAVRAVNCLAVSRAFDEMHLGRAVLQPIGADSVQDETGRVSDDDEALRVLSEDLEAARRLRARATRADAPATARAPSTAPPRSGPAGRSASGQ